MGEIIIEAKDIHRSFGQTPALRGASMAVAKGVACWECTKGPKVAELAALPAAATAPNAELWDFSLDFYQGKEVRRLDVAPLGTQAPAGPVGVCQRSVMMLQWSIVAPVRCWQGFVLVFQWMSRGVMQRGRWGRTGP